MNYSDRKAFVISAVCHGLLLGLAILLILRPPAQAEPQPVVLEMVSLPSDALPAMSALPAPDESQMPSEQPQEPAPQEPMIAQPEIAEIKQATFEELKEVPPLPEPEPEPEPEPQPTEPANTPSPKPPPQPAKKAEPAKKPEPKVMTADQFRREVGLPKQARRPRPKPQPTTTTRPTTSAPVRIDTSGVARSLQGLLTTGSSSASRAGAMSASEQSALLGYLSSLRANIRAAWVLPDSVNGTVEWAEVLVTIEADGRISNVRIGKHQGSAAFLESIKRAVRNARPVGPTPSRQREHARYTLNLRDM